VELGAPAAPGYQAHHQQMLEKRRATDGAATVKLRQELETRSKTRAADAAAHPAPTNTQIIVQAESFSGQGGGEVKIVDNKVGAVEKAVAVWNVTDHWLEWTVTAPAEAYYNLSVCYASEDNGAEREIKINGQAQEPQAALQLPFSGGWANSGDDWTLSTVTDPTTSQPLLIKLNAGTNTIRLTNTGGKGANLDYLVVTSPDVQPARLRAGK
jgi:hypothetical protein